MSDSDQPPHQKAENVALPYLRNLAKTPPAEAYPFPFPIMRGGTYALRNGGYVLVTNVNADKKMCIGIKACPDEYGEGFWIWYIQGPPDWATAARGMPDPDRDHALDIVKVVSLPEAPRPWWRRILERFMPLDDA